jgi:hypothetical protein
MSFTVEYRWRGRDGVVSRRQEFEVPYAQNLEAAVKDVHRAFSHLPSFGLYVVEANIRPEGVQLRHDLLRA